jgi:hypothetical protein
MSMPLYALTLINESTVHSETLQALNTTIFGSVCYMRIGRYPDLKFLVLNPISGDVTPCSPMSVHI